MAQQHTIKESSVMLRLSFSRLGATRAADKDCIKTNADKSRLTLSKRLFVSDAYAEIAQNDQACKLWVLRRAIHVGAGFGGVYLLPIALLEQVEARLLEYKEQRAELVARFGEVYPAERDEAQARLGEHFSAEDYPDWSVAKNAFAFSWRYVAFEVPETLPKAIRERQLAEQAKQYETMQEEVKDALRQSFAELTAHLADKLTPDADGKRKVIRTSTIDNLVEFIELFSARNVANDEQLAELAAKAESLLAGATTGARQGQDIREVIATGMQEIAEASGKLVEKKQVRKFDFSA